MSAPKTCQNCAWWRPLGTLPPARLVMESRVVVVAAGPQGECRACAPHTDFCWPLTQAGDWCGRHAGKGAVVVSPTGAEQLNFDGGTTGQQAEPAAGVMTPPADPPRVPAPGRRRRASKPGADAVSG